MEAQQSFSVSQANRLLPDLRVKVERIVEIHKEMKAFLAGNKESIDLARQTGNAPVDPVYFEMLERMQAALDDVTDLGCQVKDLETGLIDFPAVRDGRTVLLCWRLGEDSVGHWHELDAGFSGRKPVESDFA
jgi:hypothetical protein